MSVDEIESAFKFLMRLSEPPYKGKTILKETKALIPIISITKKLQTILRWWITLSLKKLRQVKMQCLSLIKNWYKFSPKYFSLHAGRVTFKCLRYILHMKLSCSVNVAEEKIALQI